MNQHINIISSNKLHNYSFNLMVGVVRLKLMAGETVLVCSSSSLEDIFKVLREHGKPPSDAAFGRLVYVFNAANVLDSVRCLLKDDPDASVHLCLDIPQYVQKDAVWRYFQHPKPAIKKWAAPHFFSLESLNLAVQEVSGVTVCVSTN